MTQEYAALVAPLLPLAVRAYGSRDTVSPQHDASREYTRLLCEYYAKRGSLLDMAAALGVTYAGLRRRVTTASLKPSSGRARTKYPQEVYDAALAEIIVAKLTSTEEYHLALHKYFEAGLSMAKVADMLGLSSANPIYYSINRVRLEQSGELSPRT